MPVVEHWLEQERANNDRHLKHQAKIDICR